MIKAYPDVYELDLSQKIKIAEELNIHAREVVWDPKNPVHQKVYREGLKEKNNDPVFDAYSSIDSLLVGSDRTSPRWGPLNEFLDEHGDNFDVSGTWAESIVEAGIIQKNGNHKEAKSMLDKVQFAIKDGADIYSMQAFFVQAIRGLRYIRLTQTDEKRVFCLRQEPKSNLKEEEKDKGYIFVGGKLRREKAIAEVCAEGIEFCESQKSPYDKIFDKAEEIELLKMQKQEALNNKDRERANILQRRINMQQDVLECHMEKFDPALLARVAESRMGLEIEEQKLKAGVYEELEREPKPFIVTETPLYMGIMNVQMLANAKCKQKASASEKE